MLYNLYMNVKQVAKYYLARASDDGDLITNLKMQKLVYYAYVWTLVNQSDRLFNEPIEAWPNGPVVADLYHDLKQFGAGPIAEDYIGDIDEVMQAVTNSGHQETLDNTYERYAPLSAFELVNLTHNEEPWVEARKGKKPTDQGDTPITDETIISFYSH